MQKNIQWVIDRIVERLIPAIGSFMTSALQRMLILSHAEHHSQLEEQAQRYEAAGRPEIAQLIREQAKQMTLEKPLPLAEKILEEFDATNPALFEGMSSTPPLALPDPNRRMKLRKRPDDTPPEVEGGPTS